MITVKTVAELREAIGQARAAGRRVGFVPTMGNLHAGHIALVRTARAHADFVVASIFVNPLQFGPTEDLDSYPRTLEQDQRKLVDARCDLLFAPGVEDMYPDGQARQTLVSVPEVSEGLCGASRPGHFTGVATVVAKLLNMVQPDVAVFGRKDYQQLAVIRRMVRDLNVPVEIVGQPIERDVDGLALSSRNGYLSAEERAIAPVIHRTLQWMAERLRAGDDRTALRAQALQRLEAAGLRPDYLELRTADSLAQPAPGEARLVLLVAAFLGRTRLIDNLEVDLSAA